MLKDKECICKNEIDLILAESDRHMVEFQTVICKNCGLVRAKKYFLDENVSDFYANHYRKICGSYENIDNEYLFNSQYVGKKNRFDLIKIHSQKKLKNLKIVDLEVELEVSWITSKETIINFS